MEPTTKRFIHTLLFLLALLLSSNSFCQADVNQDREKCANQLVGLMSCLPYVSGDPKAKAPTMDCCTGLKLVVEKSKECLCILIKDRNDPTLNLKINATLALSLPQKCNVPGDVSECPALLHLPPNAPEAKVFNDFSNHANGSSITSSPPRAASSTGVGSPTDSSKNEAGKTARWLRKEMVLGLFIIVALHIFPKFLID